MDITNPTGTRGILAAQVVQALRDSTSKDIETFLDAIAWLLFEAPAYLTALDLPPDPEPLVTFALAGMGMEVTDRRGMLRA